MWAPLSLLEVYWIVEKIGNTKKRRKDFNIGARTSYMPKGVTNHRLEKYQKVIEFWNDAVSRKTLFICNAQLRANSLLL